MVLVWLFDHRGGYALLLIDAETGQEPRRSPCRFRRAATAPTRRSSPAATSTTRTSTATSSSSTRRNGEFTFCHKTAPQMAMSMTEDDRGVIWSVTYPNSGLVSFNPATGEFKDYGHCTRRTGCSIRATSPPTSGLDLLRRSATPPARSWPSIPQRPGARRPCRQTERAQGERLPSIATWTARSTAIIRASNKLVPVPRAARPTKIGQHPQRSTASRSSPARQGLFHREFPDGRRLRRLRPGRPRLIGRRPPRRAKSREAALRLHERRGAHHGRGRRARRHDLRRHGLSHAVLQLRSANRPVDQSRQLQPVEHGRAAGRPLLRRRLRHGFLLEWDPAQPWVPPRSTSRTATRASSSSARPTINRPHALLAHPDGKTLVLAGTPGYGYTGGGLLFWDRTTPGIRACSRTRTCCPSTPPCSSVALPDGKMLGGTTTAAGTGGERKAEQAELYILDMATKKVEWHEAVFPGVQEYTDLCAGPDGLVFGIADHRRFFVFDPAARKVVHEENVIARFGPTVSQQGPRVFVDDDDGTLYMLFVKGIAKVDVATYQVTMLAESPVPISPGGDMLNGRIYFGSGSHLYSWGRFNHE